MTAKTENYFIVEKPADFGPIYAKNWKGNHYPENLIRANRQFFTSADNDLEVKFFFQDHDKSYFPNFLCLYDLRGSVDSLTSIKLELSSDITIPILTINGSHTSGVGTISINSVDAYSLQQDDIITINGVNTKYTVVSTVVWSSGGAHNVNITPNLAVNLSGNEKVYCNRLDSIVYTKIWDAVNPIFPWGEWTPYSTDIPWGGYPIIGEWYLDHFVKVIDTTEYQTNSSIYCGKLTITGKPSGTYSITRFILSEALTINAIFIPPFIQKTIFVNNRPVRAIDFEFRGLSASIRQEIERVANTAVYWKDDVLFYVRHNDIDYVNLGIIPQGDIDTELSQSVYSSNATAIDEWITKLKIIGYEK